MTIKLTLEIHEDVYQGIYIQWYKEYLSALRNGFKTFTFDEWLIERLKDIYNGPQKWGADAILEHSD